MATLSFGFLRLVRGAGRQTQLVQVLCDGGASPVLWPGPASSLVVPVGLTASTVGQSRCGLLYRGSGGGGRPVNIWASIFSNSLRESTSIRIDKGNDLVYLRFQCCEVPTKRTVTSSHLVDVDEKTVGLDLRVDDSTFRPLPLQQLLELTPLLPEA